VSDTFAKIEKECDIYDPIPSDQPQARMFIRDECNKGVSGTAYTFGDPGDIYFCPGAFELKGGVINHDNRQKREFRDLTELLIHELTHVKRIAGTADITYRWEHGLKLWWDDALNNADNYAWYAKSFLEDYWGEYNYDTASSHWNCVQWWIIDEMLN
jgi:hypothetical protein